MVPEPRNRSRRGSPSLERDGRAGARSTPSRARRTRSPPNRSEPEPETVSCSRPNMQLLLATIDELVKLVEVERLLIAHKRRWQVEDKELTVVKNVLVRFNHNGYHLGLLVKYMVENERDMVLVQSGHAGMDAPPFLRIPVSSISSRNPLVEPEWQQHGMRELAALQEYQGLHKRRLTLHQAAEAAWRRQAALDWFDRYGAEEDMAQWLPRLLSELQDSSEVRRIGRKFQIEYRQQRQQQQSSPPHRQPRRHSPIPQRQQPRSSSPQRHRRDSLSPRRQHGEPAHGGQGNDALLGQQDSKLHDDVDRQQHQRQQHDAEMQGAGPKRPSSRTGGSNMRGLPNTTPASPASGPVPGRSPAASNHRRANPSPHSTAGSQQHLNERQQQQQWAASKVAQQHESSRNASIAGSDARSRGIAPLFISLSPDPGAPPSTVASAAQPELQATDGEKHQQRQQATVDLQAARESARRAQLNSAGPLQQQAPASGPLAGNQAGGGVASSQAAGGTKRKRAPIQWEPQPSQPGDAPLQSAEVLAAKAAVAAGAAAEPRAKQQKVGTGGAKAKANANADGKRPAGVAAHKSFTITLRSSPLRGGGSGRPSPAPSEDGELPERVAKDGDRPVGRPSSRLDSHASGPTAAIPRHNQRHSARDRDERQPTPDLADFPPGFGAPSSTPSKLEPEAGCGGDNSGGGVTGYGASVPVAVRVRLPGASGDVSYADRPLPGSASGHAPYQAAAPPAADGPPGTLAGRFGFTAAQQRLLNDDPEQPMAAAAAATTATIRFTLANNNDNNNGNAAGLATSLAPFAAKVFPPAVLPNIVGGNRYDGSAMPASPAALLAYAQQLQQAQQVGDLQQQLGMLAAMQMTAAAAGARHGSGSLGVQQSADVMQGLGESPPQHGRRISRVEQRGGAGSGRFVQLDSGSTGAAVGGSKGRQSAAGGVGPSSAGTAGFWDPMWCWESQAVALLRRQRSDMTVGDMQAALPLPALWDQSIDAFYAYIARRKQVFVVKPSSRGRQHARVHSAPGARAFLAYKRSLLQLLAERQPRLSASSVQRLLPLPADLENWLRREAESDFPRFVGKYMQQEVAVVGSGDAQVLELRPFQLDAAGSVAGNPKVKLPTFKAQCKGFFHIKGGCKFGDHCYNSHVEPRC